MHESIERLLAPHDRMLHLWSWAEGLDFPAGAAVELRAVLPLIGKLSLTQRPNERPSMDGLEAHCKFALMEYWCMRLIQLSRTFFLDYPRGKALLCFSVHHLIPHPPRVQIYASIRGGGYGISIKLLLGCV